MKEVYEPFFDHSPAINQEITIDYTLVAAADSSDEQTTGVIKHANDERLVIEKNGKDTRCVLKEKYGGLQVYTPDGYRLGPVQNIIEH